jgi:hypothetical protein
MLNGIFGGFMKQRAHNRLVQFKTALIHYEARIGGRIFGKVPRDGRREFFCLDKHTWVWHEEWTDEHGKHRVVTTRYDVRPQGILKSQGHMQYQALTREEARNFRRAVRLYNQQVTTEYQRLLGTS